MPLHDLPVYRGSETLDPRLRSLLSLGPTSLFAVHQSELNRFDAATREFHRAVERLRVAHDPDDPVFVDGVRHARRALIAPRTFAVRYPGNQQDAGYVSALVWSDASAEDLTNAGITVRSQAVTTFAADIPLRLLWPFVGPTPSAIELAAAFKYVELARPWYLDLIDAIPTAHADVLQASGIAGNGVVVGIIDTGIDIYHPHFIDAATGTSRIEYLWDQTLTAQGTEHGPTAGPDFSASYGVEYTNADINSDLPNMPEHQIVRSRDYVGHGTLVASCAASGGHLDRGLNTYVGAAPGARIIAVKLDGWRESRVFADSESVLDAVAYIYSRAAALGMPCVINLSMSDNLGAHDGTANGERYLDEMLLTPGRAFVCSAGNQNVFGLHVRGVVPAAGVTNELEYRTATHPTLPPVEPRFNDNVQIWYDGHDRLSLTIDVPATAATPAVTVGPVAPGTTATAGIPGTGISIEVQSDIGDPRNGDNCIDVAIHNPAGDVIPLGRWKWTLAPAAGATLISGVYHAWADKHELSLLRSWLSPTATDGTIGIPATGRLVIAVGMHGRGSAGSPGPIIISSGRGPTRDGRLKPELCASGVVDAARSKDLSDPASSGLLRPGTGTSCAAPLVAGAAAQLFECRGGSLTSGDIKQLLLDSVRSSSAPVNAVGFGTLNVGTACVKALTNADVWIRDAAIDVGVEPYAGVDPPFSSPDIVLLDAAGNPTANPQYDPTNLWNNLIDVTVRNRGTGVARNVDVYLCWTDPATYIPFPSAWYSAGIYTGGPAFLTESNRVVVSSIPPGGSATVRFAWAPPSPGGNIRADAHYCLLARVEHEDDPSNVAAGGWGVIAGSNNVAMRNVEVLDIATPAAPTGLRIVGSGDMDAMEYRSDAFRGAFDVIFPTGILPWRELQTLAALPVEARGQIDVGGRLHRDLDARATTRILGIEGASRAQVRGSLTSIRAEGNSPHIHIPMLRLREGAAAPVRIFFNSVQLHGERGFLNIAQRSGGKIVGGVQFEFRPEVAPAPRYVVTHEGDTVTVRLAKEDEQPAEDAKPRRIPPHWWHTRRRATV
jgi:hypothetical protein